MHGCNGFGFNSFVTRLFEKTAFSEVAKTRIGVAAISVTSANEKKPLQSWFCCAKKGVTNSTTKMLYNIFFINRQIDLQI